MQSSKPKYKYDRLVYKIPTCSLNALAGFFQIIIEDRDTYTSFEYDSLQTMIGRRLREMSQDVSEETKAA